MVRRKRVEDASLDAGKARKAAARRERDISDAVRNSYGAAAIASARKTKNTRKSNRSGERDDVSLRSNDTEATFVSEEGEEDRFPSGLHPPQPLRYRSPPYQDKSDRRRVSTVRFRDYNTGDVKEDIFGGDFYRLPLDQFLRKNGHDAIERRLHGLQLGHVCDCGNPNREHTVLSTILNNATNWDDIVFKRLDAMIHVSAEGGQDENDPDFGVTIDFRQMFGHKDKVVKEILFHGHKKAQVVLSHPVFDSYLQIEARKLKRFFRTTILLYLLFLFSYTAHQINVFCFRFDGQHDVDTFPDCFSNGHNFECVFGLLTAVSLALLLILEFFLVFTFKMRYFHRFDVFVKLTVYATAAAGFFLQTHLAALKYLSAFSVPLAWMQLVLLSGFHGATISIMFIHIMHKRFMGALMLTLTLTSGFGAGFLIIAYKEGKSLSLAEGVQLLIKPLLMILGEYDFEGLKEKHEADMATMFYASFLLVLLALVGSVVLVNLLLALIMSDIRHLYELAHRKELFRKARQVVFFERMSNLFGRDASTRESVTVCIHDQCHCGRIKLKDRTTAQLKKIVRGKKKREAAEVGGGHHGLRPATTQTADCVIDEILEM